MGILPGNQVGRSHSQLINSISIGTETGEAKGVRERLGRAPVRAGREELGQARLVDKGRAGKAWCAKGLWTLCRGRWDIGRYSEQAKDPGKSSRWQSSGLAFSDQAESWKARWCGPGEFLK